MAGDYLCILKKQARANPVVINTIVWGNSADTDPGINATMASFQLYYCLVQDSDYINFDNSVFRSDPLFADTLGHLSEQSPAIGNGVASLELNDTTYFAPSTDFEGNPRPSPADALVDIGAFESPYLAVGVNRSATYVTYGL